MPSSSDPNFSKGQADAAAATPAASCTGCPLSATCATADPTLVECAVTGTLPPPALPSHAPSPAPGAELDITEVVSRGVETAVGAAFGLGWTDLLAAVIERTNATDSSGNEVDWGRLQLGRNLLCLALVNLVPLHGAPASRWAADAVTTHGLAAPLVPAGAVLGVAGAVFIGAGINHPIGLLCRAALTVATTTGRLTWRLVRSRLGWILTRPVIWTGVSGLVIVTWRAVVHLLAGA
ncbi:hypothetical protein PYK79_08605 [Streptomyces sp. ID05-04B]|uniref:hypothetical protein n=1 Tax=Streptomyces sp. ID05-04B TaxID=3028661 RepID=UPI0029C48575|nr:hypothetical protein [Streptomyces sp. ID05-04B]MDX5563321.1 hypothetical protein [Streptomyces sp. ID05-04B]